MVNEMKANQIITILYTNHRGETGWRQIFPRNIRYAETDWHPEPQWLLEAFDLERNAERSFAIKDIKQWNNSELDNVSSRSPASSEAR